MGERGRFHPPMRRVTAVALDTGYRTGWEAERSRVPACGAGRWEGDGVRYTGREGERVTGILIRDTVPGDMTVLRDVFRRSSLSNDGDRANLLANPEVLVLPDLAVREGRTRAAVADGVIVGFATWLGAGDGAVEIEDLFVDPGWMRRGTGRALVLDLIAIARGRGIDRVEVTANQHALAFYEKAGFAVYREEATRFGPAPRMRLDVGVAPAS